MEGAAGRGVAAGVAKRTERRITSCSPPRAASKSTVLAAICLSAGGFAAGELGSDFASRARVEARAAVSQRIPSEAVFTFSFDASTSAHNEAVRPAWGSAGLLNAQWFEFASAPSLAGARPSDAR